MDNITPLTVYPAALPPSGDNTYLPLDQGNWTTGLLPGLAFTGLPFLNLDKFAKGDAIYFSAARSFTSGNYSITCTGANFTSTDVASYLLAHS